MGEPWYRAAFGHAYLALYRHRDLGEARRLIAFLERRKLLAEPIVDLGCGPGRHLLALAESGHPAIGIDLSEPLLRSARESLLDHGFPALLVQADIRALPLATGRFGMALSLFTTFGYFDDPSDDRQVLAEVNRVLRPGGHFLLDFLNAVRVREEAHEATHRQEADVTIDETRSISADGRRVLKEVRLTDETGGRHLVNYVERVTLFERAELEGLLAEAGLESLEALGSYEGEPFDVSRSSRLMLLARKRA